ncbi:MAG TPA: HEAT repeat domain-containing protein [Anaerolineales bacterium]
MDLLFCPKCRYPSTGGLCPTCNIACDSPPETYIEKLMGAILSADPQRVGMAIDVLTKQLHEPRAIIPIAILARSEVDAHRLVMAARGLGWLGDHAAVPLLTDLLLNPDKPYVTRVAAAQSLGLLGGERARAALRRASKDARPSVRQASAQVLQKLMEEEVDEITHE